MVAGLLRTWRCELLTALVFVRVAAVDPAVVLRLLYLASPTAEALELPAVTDEGLEYP